MDELQDLHADRTNKELYVFTTVEAECEGDNTPLPRPTPSFILVTEGIIIISFGTLRILRS